ncbi:MAG: LacI family transcriptional regulator [Treponema sp.]|nr:LacI family transcriptional regulator [Treponema sp.]
MAKRTTIRAIAEKLGISTTTVFRALHDKPRVSEETKKAVLEAAKELDFKINVLAQSLSRRPIRIAAVIVSSFSEFINWVIEGIRHTESELQDHNVIVDYYVNTDLPDIESTLPYSRENLRIALQKNYDGVLYSGGHTCDELTLLREKNVPVAIIVNDVEQDKRQFCVQYDGITAGRMAAELFHWKFGKNAKVALATGSDSITIHCQTGRGFWEQAGKLSLDVVHEYYNKDNEELAYKNTADLLDRFPDIQGIYINSFNSREVINCVSDHNRAGKICLITSDINPYLKECLKGGIVSASLFQNQYLQGELAFKYLYQYITEQAPVPSNVLIKPEIIMESNVHLYDYCCR